MKLPFGRALLALLLALPALAGGADPGTVSRADSLREKPFADARVLAPLPAGSTVSILTRNGGWYQVKAGAKTGWVRMLSVRRVMGSGGSDLAGLARVASGRAGTGTVTTTTGVRGLDSEDLATATFNEAQVEKAEGYRVGRAAAEAFARQGRLVPRDVQPLPAPVKQ